MANKSGQRPQGYGKSTERIRFADITLTEAQRNAMQRDTEFQSRVWAELNAIVARGFRIVIKADDRNNTTMATAQMMDEDNPDANVIFVMRSRHGGKALAYLAYAYSVVGDGEFPYNQEPQEEEDEEFPW